MIRAACPDDAGAIRAIYAHYVEAGAISFEDAAPDAATMRTRMDGDGGLYPWLVSATDTGVQAYAYASGWSVRSAYRWAVETTIYVAPDARGGGVGARLYRVLLEQLRTQGFTQAIGRISLPNTPSERLHAALGFACTGVLRGVGWKHGRWIDVAQWQRALAEPAAPPAEPLRFADVGLVRATDPARP